jgi:hypothetical protein
MRHVFDPQQFVLRGDEPKPRYVVIDHTPGHPRRVCTPSALSAFNAYQEGCQLFILQNYVQDEFSPAHLLERAIQEEAETKRRNALFPQLIGE